MLIKRRCTATGVINFYSKQEPYIAIGSVISRPGPNPFIWRYYGETRPAGGAEQEWKAVERAMNDHHRRALTALEGDRHAA
jgi:hypothetical protein